MAATLTTAPIGRPSFAHTIDGAPPISICHSIFCPLSSVDSRNTHECGFRTRTFVTAPCASTFFVSS